MYFMVKEDSVQQIDRETFEQEKDVIAVMSVRWWNEDSYRQAQYGMWRTVGRTHFCKMESYQEYLYSTFRIPSHQYGESGREFALFYGRDRLFLLGDEEWLAGQVTQTASKAKYGEYSMERFLYDFLVELLDQDLQFLEKIEFAIAQIEEEVLKRRTRQFNVHMLQMKKQIGRFYQYYHQLVEVGQELVANDSGLFGDEDTAVFQMYTDKVTRLSDEAQALREYAMQVQEVYQSEIEIRQNAVMKVLTIVTVICLPLNLIAGWYGMNFEYMPELKMRYAYPVVIAASVLIVSTSMYIFKRKHFFS